MQAPAPYDFPDEKIYINFATAYELHHYVYKIGVTLANRIVDERNKNGWYSGWDDVQKRVHGVGEMTIRYLNAQVFGHPPKQYEQVYKYEWPPSLRRMQRRVNRATLKHKKKREIDPDYESSTLSYLPSPPGSEVSLPSYQN